MVNYDFPQQAAPLRPGERGVASLTHEGRTFRFRTNPNEFRWTYTLNKRVDQTYGGRVIQLLGTKIDDFTLKADSGRGGWDYTNRVAKFLRDVMIKQRNGSPATFEYTTRGWKLNVYIVSVPFQDAVGEVLRSFEVQMKVQEDVTGLVTKNSLDAELRRLQDGMGFRRSKYNDPQKHDEKLVDVVGDIFGAIPMDRVQDSLDSLAGIIQIPGAGGGIYLPNARNGYSLSPTLPNNPLPGVGASAPTPGR